MLTEVKVPVFPESITDGVVATWHRQPGDRVRRDETLLDIETDKVLFEVPAPVDGVLIEVLAAEGETVVAGAVLARIEAGKADEGAVVDVVAPKDASGVSTPPAGTVPAERTAPPAGGRDADDDAPSAGPAVRRMMAEHGLKADSVAGSGPGGRVLKEDVQRSLDESRTGGADPVAAAKASQAAAPPPVSPSGSPSRSTAPSLAVAEERPQRRVPMTRLRARIAERLVEAQHTAAILATFNEVNMQPVMALRQRHRERFESVHGVKLGFMSFFVRAVVEALRRYPVINASIEGEEIVHHGFYDIGIAVASARGLVVPVLRDADRIGMAEIERRIADYASRAAAGSLTLEEIVGGTFTITNGGVFGSLLSTPIINPPQSAILGMHRIQERAVVEDGAIVARPMMYLALSYDHRLIDGREAVLFLVAIKELLEDPVRLLLEV